MNKRIIVADKAPKAIGPYSQAVEANGFVFLSGQIPLDPANGQIVPGGVQEQAEQVIANIKAILEAAGCSLKNVVKALPLSWLTTSLVATPFADATSKL